MKEKIRKYTAPILLLNIIAGSIAAFYVCPEVYKYFKSKLYNDKVESSQTKGLEWVIEE